MASINHYPAHTPEQVFTCEATAEVIGRTQGLPYLTTIFCDYVDLENTSHGLLTINVQSKYPAFASQSAQDKPAISFYADGYDNFRLHVSWKLTDNSTMEHIVPYCYLDPITIFVRNIIEQGAYTIGTGLIQSGLSGTGLKYADEPIESYPHVVDDTTIGQLVVEKYGGYNYVRVVVNAFGRILKKTSQWTTPATDSDLSEKRVVTHIRSREDDPTTFFYSSRILDFDYRIIYGESFSSGAEWLAWCKAH